MQAGTKLKFCGSENVIRSTIFRGGNRGGGTSRLPSNPMARSLRDLISARQIQMADRLSRTAGIDANLISQELFDCEINELSKLAAEKIINVLEDSALNSRVVRELRLTG